MNRSILFALPLLALTGACAIDDGATDERPSARAEASLGAEEPGPLACGGLLGLACPDKFTCVDDWRDDCDLDNGGADCPGLCEHSDGGAACATGIPFGCGPAEVCVAGPYATPCAPPADDVPPQCFDGTCVAADCGLVAPYDPSILDCANTPIRCAHGYTVHEDACGCSCVPACDPTLLCGDALTCIDGDLYPTTCGPANCDLPIGGCKPYP